MSKGVAFSTALQKPVGKLYYSHLVVPIEIAKHFIKGKLRRVICRLNDTLEIHAALLSDGTGGFYIQINQQVRKKLGLTHGGKVQVELFVDTSKYGIPMPSEFEELLHQDPEGNTAFHALTPGKQRSLIYVIGKPKSSQIRIEKAIITLDYVKQVQGKIDFIHLSELLKRRNRRF